MVEPVSSRPASCDTSSSVGVDRSRRGDLHDAPGVSCHRLLGEGGRQWSGGLRSNRHAGASAERQPAGQGPELFLARARNNSAGDPCRSGAASSHGLPELPGWSAAARHCSRAVLACDRTGGSPQLWIPALEPRLRPGTQRRCSGYRSRRPDRNVGGRHRKAASGLRRGSSVHGRSTDSDFNHTLGWSAAQPIDPTSQHRRSLDLAPSPAACAGGQPGRHRNPVVAAERTAPGSGARWSPATGPQ